MKLPIDTSNIDVTCSLKPEPVLDYTTKQPKADQNGEPLYQVELVAYTDEGAQVFNVKFPGTPAPGLRQGIPVKVTDLVVSDWSRDNKFGLAFRAAKVEPLNGTAAKASGQAHG